ncbi:MAG: GntR family transcriptional regulator [Rothia sp. (in: high G+C Gram-positive bacteria)]|uniref:FadR/GntR family transcriptional regulator n=1 Tax=Rothia sp. (in: high G+C Gram-positive bacteria) TaxID=1885016 RepID=UPI0026DF4D76|nr:GntR family transcriptional regulator [Rothia sp. (in: high G+C Gram-positive bacteria)]MDO5749858.1 GntR family transcriptional regulator [Rothia sp. (in: high G+C Gram-positive bacteria)]
MQDRSYSLLLDTFERRLRMGELRVGDRLPSERALAEKYGISRPSVREALHILSALGLIRSSSGSGPKSGAIVISEPTDAISWSLRMHIATRSLPVQDVVSTRLLLEGSAARAAALAEDSPERSAAIARALEHLTEMDSEQVSDERFHFCDARFHYELSALGGNIVLDTVIDSLHMATVSYVQEAVPQLEDWQGVKRTLQQQHRGILEAVVARDEQTAYERVCEHIQWFYALSSAARKDTLPQCQEPSEQQELL